jgi:hypothetical protein
MREFKAQLGFLTIAQNTAEVDYLRLAYVQAQNIKATQPNSNYAVIVDSDTAKLVTDEHRSVIDYVIELPIDHAKDELWKMSNEWQVFSLTPFKETIKLESDLLFTRDISHWIQGLRLRDICFSLNCYNYQEEQVTSSPYRTVFANNDLPNVYTGMYYFRFSHTSAEFFRLARQLYANWADVAKQLIQCDAQPSTDLVFAVAAKITGIDVCTIPSLEFFKFTHMKSQIQGWSDQQPWTDYVNVEHDGNIIRINNTNQYQPVHYYEKNFVKSS